MRKTEFIELIEKSELINEEAVHSIKKYLNENPYFQTGQLLLLKGLLNTNSVEYNTHLRKTAAYIYDRKKTFYEYLCDIHNKGTLRISGNNFCPPYPDCFNNNAILMLQS